MQFEFDGSEGRIGVRVWEHPGARRLVVIAHGYGEHIERYDHVARALRARGAAVYGPDHLGHGRSAGERVLIADVEHVVDDMAQVVERAQATYPGLPVVLLGHSMGGLIATRLAQRAERPRLAGLVLSGPAIGLGPVLAQMIDAGFADQPLDVTALSHDPAVGEAYAADPLVHHGPLQRESLVGLFGAVDQVAAGPGLGSLPVLWLHGEGDVLAFYGSAKVLTQKILGEQLTSKSYPGAQHEILNETNKEEVLDDLSAFLARFG